MNESRFAHITKVHPCFNEKMHDKVGRIHVPIAPKCNIHCDFCTREINKCEQRPGVASRVMTVDQAVEHVKKGHIRDANSSCWCSRTWRCSFQ